MPNSAELAVILTAKDRYSKQLNGLRKDVNQASSAMRQLSNVAAAFGVTMGAAGVMRIVKGAISTFADFQQAMARAGAITGASAVEMAGMEQAARDLGRTTQFSATQAAEALTFLSMAGFSVRDATKALPGVLQLAAAAQIDMAQAADIASNVLSGYGLKVEELQRVNDVLAKTFTSSNTDLTQLADAMKMAGPVASAAGLRFEETSAALGLMGNAGIQATMAGTALRGSISKLLAPSAEASGILSSLGITVLNAQGDMLPLVEIIRQLEASSITTGQAMDLFGERAGPAMLALISQGSGALEELTAQLHSSGGTAERIAEQQMDTLTGSLQELKSASDELSIVMSENLEPSLRENIGAMTDLLLVTADVVESNSDLISSFQGSNREALMMTPVIGGLIQVYDQMRERAAALREEAAVDSAYAQWQEDMAAMGREAETAGQAVGVLASQVDDLGLSASTASRSLQGAASATNEITEATEISGIAYTLWLQRHEAVIESIKTGREEAAKAADAAEANAERERLARQRVSQTWDDFLFRQSAVSKAINQNNVGMADILAAVAARSGMELASVIAKMKELDVSAGDVKGIIEALGQAFGLSANEILRMVNALGNVNNVVSQARGDQEQVSGEASRVRARRQSLLNEYNHNLAQVRRWNARAAQEPDPAQRERFLTWAAEAMAAAQAAKRERDALPIMDTGGLLRGPGVFRVGTGVTEIARPAQVMSRGNGGIHIHLHNSTIYGFDDFQRKVAQANKRNRQLGGEF